MGNAIPANQTVNGYYNIGAFNPIPQPGHIGNCGVGSLEGPGTASIAAGLAKTFALGERARLRFEATFTNLLNHPNFAPPAVDVSSPAMFWADHDRPIGGKRWQQNRAASVAD